MMLEVIPDRFASIPGEGPLERPDDASLTPQSSLTSNHVRRMTRGTVLKEDTFATLRLVAGNDSRINLVDAGSNRKKGGKPIQIGNKTATDVYSNFLLQQISEDRMEKQQIMETFGEPYIFFFGERARVMSFSGILANTFDFNWEAEWWHNYENYLRGTRCVEQDARVFLSFDNTIIGGYIISTAATKVAEQRNFVQFQFQIFVTSYANFVEPGDPKAQDSLSFAKIGIGEEVKLSEEFLNVFRPKLLSSTPSAPDGMRVGSGNLPGEIQIQTPDLGDFGEVVDESLKFLSAVWSGAARVLRDIEDRSMRVRVPLGFEGALAFDSDADAHYINTRDNNVIRLGVFSDNFDEYVGSSDHYGSSSPSGFDFIGSTSAQDELTKDQALVRQAEKFWLSKGLKLPETSSNEVSSFLVNGTLGLLAVGASALWNAAAVPNTDALSATLARQDEALEASLTSQARAAGQTVLTRPPIPE